MEGAKHALRDGPEHLSFLEVCAGRPGLGNPACHECTVT